MVAIGVGCAKVLELENNFLIAIIRTGKQEKVCFLFKVLLWSDI